MRPLLCVIGATALFAGATCASAQDLGDFQIFQTGLPTPIFLGSPPGEPERILIAQIGGIIRVVENGVLLPTPFLDIRARLRLQHGLIGVAFPPDYATSRRFYLNYTPADSEEPRIARYTTSSNPNIANTTEEILLHTGPGSGDHNAGWMEFGPDGYLYIARGDAGRDGSNPQDPNFLLGKMLRIDVSPDTGYVSPPDNPFVGTEGRDEIFAMGLRNPWRNSFDSLTGDLYIADVGQWEREEVNLIPAGSPGGQNFGWPCLEGLECFGKCPCDGPGFTDPILELAHDTSSCIIGGPVYRGAAIPRWRGRYFFADLYLRELWSFRYVDGVAVDFQRNYDGLIETIPNERNDLTISFGTDGEGEMYVLELPGRILKIVPEYAPADWNLDGAVNSSDFFAFLVDFFELNSDMTGDHVTNSQDFFEYLHYFFGQ